MPVRSNHKISPMINFRRLAGKLQKEITTIEKDLVSLSGVKDINEFSQANPKVKEFLDNISANIDVLAAGQVKLAAAPAPAEEPAAEPAASDAETDPRAAPGAQPPVIKPPVIGGGV